jgi:hypothetical protein
LGERPRLCHLLASCAAVLERNVPIEVARDFKSGSVVRLQRLGELARHTVPELSPERATQLAGITWALVAGAWPMANPSPAMAALLDEPQLASVRVDFVPDVADALTLLLLGMVASA